MNVPPEKGKTGESKFGLTVGERVEVTGGGFFKGWIGHVRSFGCSSVAVDLDEPPEGHNNNGQFFIPEHLRSVLK